MGRSVFVGIVGLGQENKETKTWEFERAVYTLDGRQSGETNHVQVAAVELLDRSFDIAYLLCTPKSYKEHFDALKSELDAKGIANVKAIMVEISDKPDQLWRWFKQLSEEIKIGDHVVFDITHGMKQPVVVITLAIDFLRKRGTKVDHVFYGAIDKKQSEVPKGGVLQDMIDFFRINDWTDALQAIKDRFDPEPFAKMVGEPPPGTPKKIRRRAEEFAERLQDLRHRIYGSAMHEVVDYTGKVKNSLTAWRAQLKEDQTDRPQQFVAEHLAKQIEESLDPFAEAWDGRYDRRYFNGQLEYLRLLIDHHLLMQAYTVLRELIGSLAFVDRDLFDIVATNDDGRTKRTRYCEVFIGMVAPPTGGNPAWRENKREQIGQLEPIIECLKENEALPDRETIESIKHYRNGFDHAWTSKKLKDDAAKKIEGYYEEMKRIVKRLIETGMVR